MIEWCKGDILDDAGNSNHPVVIPVNTRGILGAGLARQFRERFPKDAEYYISLCKQGLLRMGEPTYSRTSHFVFFPTKDHWMDNSHLDDILAGLVSMVSLNTAHEKYNTVSFCKIGCGLGGLDWKDVRPMIVEFADQFSGTTRIFGEEKGG